MTAPFHEKRHGLGQGTRNPAKLARRPGVSSEAGNSRVSASPPRRYFSSPLGPTPETSQILTVSSQLAEASWGFTGLNATQRTIPA